MFSRQTVLDMQQEDCLELLAWLSLKVAMKILFISSTFLYFFDSIIIIILHRGHVVVEGLYAFMFYTVPTNIQSTIVR